MLLDTQGTVEAVKQTSMMKAPYAYHYNQGRIVLDLDASIYNVIPSLISVLCMYLPCYAVLLDTQGTVEVVKQTSRMKAPYADHYHLGRTVLNLDASPLLQPWPLDSADAT